MSEEAGTRFETTGNVTSDLLRKTYIAFSGRYRQSRLHRFMILILSVEILLIGMMDILAEESNARLLPALIFGGVYILIELLLRWSVRYGARMTVLRFEEEVHSGVTGYTTAFSDTQVHLHRHAGGATGAIALSDIKRLMKVENVWMLVTRTLAFIPIFVEQLSEADRESVLALLRQNNPKVKIQIKGKK